MCLYARPAYLSICSTPLPAHLSSCSLSPPCYSPHRYSLYLFSFLPLKTLQQWKSDGRGETCKGFEELMSAPLSVMLCRIYDWNVCLEFFYWCYAVHSCVCMLMLCDVWWVMNRQMVHTPGFGGADMPTEEIQARMEALHGCVCLSHTCVCTWGKCVEKKQPLSVHLCV